MIRVTVIGTGAIARNLHLPCLTAHPDAKVVAICGRNQEKARKVADEFVIGAVYSDYRRMIEAEGPDAVLVLTPDNQHYPMSLYAISKGYHVLCEKPLAMNSSESEEMLRKAEDAGILHMTFLNQRQLPQFAFARDLQMDGYIGTPTYFHCDFSSESNLTAAAPDDWHNDPSQCMGVLGDFGSHVIDMMMWYFGEVPRLTAATWNASDSGHGVARNHDSAVVQLELSRGTIGTTRISKAAATNKSREHYRIEGNEGALEVTQAYFAPVSRV